MKELEKTKIENGITYNLVGDYYIPALELPEEHRTIGRWGRLHKRYLEKAHPAVYQELVLSGKLWTLLADLDEQATDRYESIVEQMKEAESVTEKLKACDQMAWVRAMNSICSRAEEIILHEMIYS